MTGDDYGTRRDLPPQLQSLLALWSGKCTCVPPCESDFTAEELAPWQDHLALIELTASARFRFRSCGAALIVRLGREATGTFSDGLAGGIAQGLTDTFKCVVALAAPMVAHPRGGHADLVLPLRGEAGSISLLLFGSYEIT